MSMRNRVFTYILTALAITLTTSSINTFASPNCLTYSKFPPFLSSNAAPTSHLLVDFSGSMNNHAYEGNTTIFWDTGTENATAHTGYNSSAIYDGYFENNSTYTHNSNGFVLNSTGNLSGNMLNWALMHKIDILKKSLTGGDFNATEKRMTISATDGNSTNLYRGQYHIHIDTANVTGFKQDQSDNIFICNGTITGTSDLTFKPDKCATTSRYILYDPDNEPVNEPVGILDTLGQSSRLSLFTFDQTANYDQGATCLVPVTSNSTLIQNKINSVNLHTSVPTHTPLAEAVYTICGYIQQYETISPVDGPRYKEISYPVGKNSTIDPFYFQLNATYGKNVPCTQQNIIIIADGTSNSTDIDANLPSELTNNDNKLSIDNNNKDITNRYLDDVAYWAHTEDLRKEMTEGNQTVNIYSISLGEDPDNILSAAAQWGGFRDYNEDGFPDPIEYDSTSPDGPDNYFKASSGPDISEAMATSLNALTNQASSGAAASVVSTSREGEGLLYQAVFWQELPDSEGKKISWAGDVFAYWLNNDGLLYEDDGDVDYILDSADNEIQIWYDDSDASSKRVKACSGGKVIGGVCNGTSKELTEVSHVWKASDWLNTISTTNIETQRDYTSSTNQRYITTWIDDDNDGVVDDGEYDDFTTGNQRLTNLLNQLGVSNNEEVINWIRGDDGTLRSRQFNGNTWRLGDVINSSPTVVAAPAENYDFYWDDDTYTQFYERWKNRRIMVYFGANDGMLHAVNSGFYNSADKAYYTSYDYESKTFGSGGLPLGAEMWAYVPYNLIPHLSCLTQEPYHHQYYVDLKPRVFDAKVFEPDLDKHPGGWGTILACGFNFGGNGEQALNLEGKNSTKEDQKWTFGSSYFIFDITDPETPPTFLGEMTFSNPEGSKDKDIFKFGYSINAPTLVAVKEENISEIAWHLLFASGPESTNGFSSQKARIITLPLNTVVEDAHKDDGRTFSFRPTNKLDGESTAEKMGIISLPQSNSCISSGLVTVDYDFDYFVDIMYYGVVTSKKEDRSGGLHRLKTENKVDPKNWNPKAMTDTDRPITGAVNVGIVDEQLWVYFGTGKYWDTIDKVQPSPQYLYGIEEPKQYGKAYNFSTIPAGNVYDVTNIDVMNNGIGTLNCTDGTTSCLPKDNKFTLGFASTVDELAEYISNSTSEDGWVRKISNGELAIGQPTLFGGLVNFTTFSPSDNLCSAEGDSKLYALYYRTGTAWKESVFGDEEGSPISFIRELGQGMGTSPSLHLGSEEGVRAFVQTSTGSIVEIHQPNLPIPNVKSGKGGWHTLDVD